MAKLAFSVCLFLAGAPAALAGDASSMDQITTAGAHRAPTPAFLSSAAGVAAIGQIDGHAVELAAAASAPEFAGRPEVRGIGLPGLGPNAVERIRRGEGHEDAVQQEGQGSAVRLVQTGLSHFARLSQAGSGHRAEVSQTGQGHWASMSQSGEFNTASIVQTGGSASAVVSQAGGFNTVSIRQ